MSEFKKEFKAFFDDIEKNVTNPQDLEYIKGRATDLFGVLLEDMERIANYKDEKLDLLLEKQHNIELKMNKMENIMDRIENDMYFDDEEDDDIEGYDFEITCPYCNNDFIISANEDNQEIVCPNCNNEIELDWMGDLDDGCGCCGGHCHDCEDDCDEDEDM